MVVEDLMLNDTETFLVFLLEWANMASMVVVLRFVLCNLFFLQFFFKCCVVDEATANLVMRVRKKGKEIRMTFDSGLVSLLVAIE